MRILLLSIKDMYDLCNKKNNFGNSYSIIINLLGLIISGKMLRTSFDGNGL